MSVQMGKRKPNTPTRTIRTIRVYLSKDDARWVKKEARKEGITVSAFLRALILRDIQK